jgi:hypothetical protein
MPSSQVPPSLRLFAGWGHNGNPEYSGTDLLWKFQRMLTAPDEYRSGTLIDHL